MTRTSMDTGFPDKLDNTAAGIRQNNPPAFVPPKADSPDAAVPTRPNPPSCPTTSSSPQKSKTR